MIYVFNIICMLPYQKLTRKSISKSTVKYNKALGLSAFYDQKLKPRTLITIPRKEYAV